MNLEMEVRVFAVSFLVILLSCSHRASACSGTNHLTYGTLFEGSYDVFRALVTKVELFNEFDKTEPKPRVIRVKIWYNLREVLQGQPKKHGPLVAGFHLDTDCGLIPRVGRDYFFRAGFYDEKSRERYGETGGVIDPFTSKELSFQERLAEEVMAKARSYLTP